MADNDAFSSYFGSEDDVMSLKEVVVDFSKTLSAYRTALSAKDTGFSEEESFLLCRDLQETYFQFLFMGLHQDNHKQ